MRFPAVFRFALLSLVAAAPLAASAQSQAPTQEELKMTSDPKAPGADAVILYREEIEDDPHHFSTVYARIKVLTEKGKEAATVHVPKPHALAFEAKGDNSSRSSSAGENHFDAPDMNRAGEDQPYDADSFDAAIEVKLVDGKTIHPDGTVIPMAGVGGNLAKEKSETGKYKETTFTLPDVTPGSILEYRYQVRYDRFQSAPEWQIQQPYFVHKAHYAYTPASAFLPNDVSGTGISNLALKDRHDEVLTDVRLASVLPAGKSVTKDAAGHYLLDLTDIPAIPQEPFAPPMKERAYQINFYYTYTPVETEYWQKEMQFWTKDLNRYIASSGIVKNSVAEMLSGSDSALDKAKKLYAVVQKLDNTDFSGDESQVNADGSVPHGKVDTVFENKKGNGNQIAFLYLAMARAAGLNARPERIVSRNRAIFSPQFLSTRQLDSVVIALTIDGKEIVLDPGEKFAPFQTLHWSHAGAGGVAMTGNGKVETIITPLALPADNKTIRVGTLAITPEGNVSGSLKVGFVGQEALYWRQQTLRTSADQVKAQLEAMLQQQVPDGIKAHVDHIAGQEYTSTQFVAVVQITGAFTGRSGAKLTLPRLFFDSKEKDPFPAGASRSLPVDMHYPAEEQEQITYTIPAGFTLEKAPEDVKLSWENNAAYQLRSKAEGNSVVSARLLARGFTLLEASDYAKLTDFYGKVAAADQQQLVLVSQAAQKGE
jgi:Transglutaminase-like superfamily